MKKILILNFGGSSSDPRVFRQINFFKDDFTVAVAANENPLMDNVSFFELTKPYSDIPKKIKRSVYLLSHFYGRYYNDTFNLDRNYSILKVLQPDIILANDIETLPLALKLKNNGVKVIFDAHEYYPDMYKSLSFILLFKSFMKCMCRECLSKTDAMLCTNKYFKEKFSRLYHVDPVIITNAPMFAKLKPTPVDSKDIKLVYHGNIDNQRRIDNVINIMDYLDERFSLHLYLMKRSSPKNYVKLKKLAEGKRNKQIYFYNPLPMQKIAQGTNEYDLGLYCYPGSSDNITYSLGNKIFEYVQARLGVIATPLPQASKMVKKYGIGTVSDDFTPQAIAESINSLSADDISRFKLDSDKNALKLSAEPNRVILRNLVNEVLQPKLSFRSYFRE